MSRSSNERLICPKCKAEMLLGEARGQHIPTDETADKDFQVDKFGNFRILVAGTSSPWTDRHSIAYIEHENKRFMAVHPEGDHAKTFHPGVILEIPEPKIN